MSFLVSSARKKRGGIKIGYLVPEFPSQTHIFFWRELQELKRAGVDVMVISTRKPAEQLISHSWSEDAIMYTIYLNQLDAKGIIAMLKEIFLLCPMALFQLAKAIITSDRGTNTLTRLTALGFMGIRLSSIAREHGWKHVHVHSCGNSANVALFANRFSGLNYSLTLHGPLRDYGDNQSMKWKHCCFALVITETLRTEVNELLKGYLPARLSVCPMGVDLDCFSRNSPLPLWKAESTLSIFSCGRLNRCKGHDDLIRAVFILREKGIAVNLFIAGADDADGDYRAYLDSLIDELCLAGQVYLLGAVPENVVVDHLQSCHVFALASLEEPLGVAIMEAMAMEVPVVATRAGGVPELIEDGIHGLLVSPSNPPEIAEAIQKITQNPELAGSMGVEARKRVVSYFGSSRSAAVLRKLILDSEENTHLST